MSVARGLFLCWQITRGKGEQEDRSLWRAIAHIGGGVLLIGLENLIEAGRESAGLDGVEATIMQYLEPSLYLVLAVV